MPAGRRGPDAPDNAEDRDAKSTRPRQNRPGRTNSPVGRRRRMTPRPGRPADDTPCPTPPPGWRRAATDIPGLRSTRDPDSPPGPGRTRLATRRRTDPRPVDTSRSDRPTARWPSPRRRRSLAPAQRDIALAPVVAAPDPRACRRGRTRHGPRLGRRIGPPVTISRPQPLRVPHARIQPPRAPIRGSMSDSPAGCRPRPAGPQRPAALARPGAGRPCRGGRPPTRRKHRSGQRRRHRRRKRVVLQCVARAPSPRCWAASRRFPGPDPDRRADPRRCW